MVVGQGCTNYVQHRNVAELFSRESPPSVIEGTTEGERIVLSRSRIEGDSLIGTIVERPGGRRMLGPEVGFRLDSVSWVETGKFAPGKTALTLLGAAAGASGERVAFPRAHS